MAQPSFIFGIHPLLELLKAKKRPVQHLYTTRPHPKFFETIKKQLPRHIPLSEVSREQLSRMAGTTEHQGIVALVGAYPIRTKSFMLSAHQFVLLLDGIQDPRNLGAIIRSAYCTGVTGVIIPRKQSSPLSATVCKASAGLIEHVEIYQPASSAHALPELTSAGYHVYLATISGQDVRTVSYHTPTCLVIGSEGTGITHSLLQYGIQIGIPQVKPEISYNASVAAGILLFHMGSALRRI